MADPIQAVVNNNALSVPEKAEGIAALLRGESDLGAAQLIRTLLATDDAIVADFAANHLSLLDGHLAEKAKIVERFLPLGDEFIGAATNLVEFLPDELIDRLIAEYLKQPSDETRLYGVLYQIAFFFPERLRAHSAAIEDSALRLGMLAGGPEAWVKDLADRYKHDRKASWLDSIARFHTPKAADTLQALAREFPEIDQDAWEAAIAWAGVLPDTAEASVYAPAHRGFVREKGASPHAMGGFVTGTAPICPNCSTPADRVLTLHAAALPFALGGTLHPSFYWFGCPCDVLSAINLQMLPHGVEVLIGPHHEGGSGQNIVPGALSLLLQPLVTQAGFGMDNAAGFGRHQVGGFPPFLEPELFPHCPLCRRVMRFLAYIDSGMTPFGRIRLRGALFGFWCATCNTTTTRHQRQ